MPFILQLCSESIFIGNKTLYEIVVFYFMNFRDGNDWLPSVMNLSLVLRVSHSQVILDDKRKIMKCYFISPCSDLIVS